VPVTRNILNERVGVHTSRLDLGVLPRTLHQFTGTIMPELGNEHVRDSVFAGRTTRHLGTLP